MTATALTGAQLRTAEVNEKHASSKSKPVAKTRVQLDLSPNAMALLTELKEKTESSTYAEVFRKAIKLYDGLITEAERGAEFLIRRDGQIAEFKIFL